MVRGAKMAPLTDRFGLFLRPLVSFQHTFAEADRFRCDLDQFVDAMNSRAKG